MYSPEIFTAEERTVLNRFFTNTDDPVFALINLPEVVKGALFARYSRSPKSLRRLFLDEFYEQPEFGIEDLVQDPDERSLVSLERAENLYDRVFSQYGDDSVAQLGGAHIACEQASNLLTKVLECALPGDSLTLDLLRTASEAATGVEPRALLAQGYKGKELGSAIRTERLKRIGAHDPTTGRQRERLDDTRIGDPVHNLTNRAANRHRGKPGRREPGFVQTGAGHQLVAGDPHGVGRTSAQPQSPRCKSSDQRRTIPDRHNAGQGPVSGHPDNRPHRPHRPPVNPAGNRLLGILSQDLGRGRNAHLGKQVGLSRQGRCRHAMPREDRPSTKTTPCIDQINCHRRAGVDHEEARELPPSTRRRGDHVLRRDHLPSDQSRNA